MKVPHPIMFYISFSRPAYFPLLTFCSDGSLQELRRFRFDGICMIQWSDGSRIPSRQFVTGAGSEPTTHHSTHCIPFP